MNDTDNGPRRCSVEDAMVGANLRRLRLASGLSQEKLAERLGLTFQQVQKYEKGRNRLSCSRVLQIAAVLGCSVSDFFNGLDGAESLTDIPLHLDLTLVEESLVQDYRSLPKPKRAALRRVIAEFKS